MRRMQPLPDGHWSGLVVRCGFGGTPMKQILVVDDDDGTADAIAELLRDSGYDAITATTGEQALAKLRRSRPDLLILDMFMTGLVALQVLEVIASDPQLARIPKVAMTAWPRPIELPPGVTLRRT